MAVFAVFGVIRYPYAYPHLQGHAFHHEGLAQCLGHPFGQWDGVGLVQPGEQDREFVAPQATDECMRFRQDILQPRTDVGQQVIANMVAKGVIDFLEVIQIQ